MERNKRREQRIMAIQKLYMLDIADYSAEEAINITLEKDIEVDEEIKMFVYGVYNKRNEIDTIISDALSNYTIERLNLVDKAIIRLAVYEMLSNTPPAIAINEAIEITKEFTDQGDHKAVSFNNRLLDTIKKHMNL